MASFTSHETCRDPGGCATILLVSDLPQCHVIDPALIYGASSESKIMAGDDFGVQLPTSCHLIPDKNRPALALDKLLVDT
jgi:hypothetical protein